MKNSNKLLNETHSILQIETTMIIWDLEYTTTATSEFIMYVCTYKHTRWVEIQLGCTQLTYVQILKVTLLIPNNLIFWSCTDMQESSIS